MIRILSLVVFSYAAVLVLVYLTQRVLQYHPDRSVPVRPFKELQELRVTTEDGLDLLAWFVPPREKDGRVIVLYHGNAGNIDDRVEKMRDFVRAGYGIYFCEYRGYGGNRGRISEEGLYRDARSALKWLDANGYKPAQWVIYGESIGSGPAVQMALEFQPERLIVEGGFSSATDVASRVYPWLPVRLLLKDTYDNISKIGKVRSRLLVVHGDEDPTIPHDLAQKLFEAANHPKQLVIIEGGGHNDLYDHHAGPVIIEWLAGAP